VYQLYTGENRNDFSLDLNIPGELLSVTVFDREFKGNPSPTWLRWTIV